MSTRFALFILILSTISIGCKKEEPTAPKATGSLAGYIYLYNENAKLSNHSGIVISIEGTGKSTVTDSLGNFSINDIEENVYTISITKAGYSTFKQEYKIWANNTNPINNEWPEPWLTSVPDYSVSALSAQLSQDGGINTVYANGTVTSFVAGRNRKVRLFAGKTNAVSSDPSKYIWTDDVHLDSTRFGLQIPLSELYSNGFTPGTKIYIIAYGENEAPLDSYLDKATGREYYGCISTTGSNIADITLP